jgi:hypothetical protein
MNWRTSSCNCYLKLFHALFLTKPTDTASVINGYKSVFPDEAPLVDAVVQETFLGQPLVTPPPIWLANKSFQTGTSLYDQFRSLPRTHTFDLNAATLVDLLGVPGMTRVAAESILKGTPYASLDDLARLPALPPGVLDKFTEMKQEMERLQSSAADIETGLSLAPILMSYAQRAVIILALASVAGALLYGRIRATRWLRRAMNGFGASLLVLMLAWLTPGTNAAIAFLGPMILFGLPASLWQLFRGRGSAQAARVLVAWAAAAIPAILTTYPL